MKMTVKICVGSSCHLKGSPDVIEAMQEIIKKYGVGDRIELQATFCLGFCAEGVSMQVDSGEPSENGVYCLHGVNKFNAEEKFLSEIFPKLTDV